MTTNDPDSRLVSRLTTSRYDGYLYQPIPSGPDDDVRAVVEAYLAADPEGRARIQERIVGKSADVLECFAERQAVIAIRSGSVEPIRVGLVAVGISLPRNEKQEALVGLAKLDHSARLLGVDLADLAKDVATILPEQSRYFMAKFLAREDRGDSLLLRMGFAAYRSGADFVYDNARPQPEASRGTPDGPVAMPNPATETFVMRKRYISVTPWDLTAIRVKRGTIVATDRLGQRRTFPLDGPGAPHRVVRYLRSRGRSAGDESHWAVTDTHGQAILSGSEDDWNSEDFARLAEGAGLRFAPDDLAPGYAAPPRRHDSVDLSADARSSWVACASLLLFLFLLPVSLVGLWSGFPWLWPVLWSIAGGWDLGGRIRDELIITRNCAVLPPDERPTAPRPKVNRPRAAIGLAVLALGPPFLVYLVQHAPSPP